MMPLFERPLFRVDGLASALRRPRAAAAAKNGFAVMQFGRQPVLGSNEQKRATKGRSTPTSECRVGKAELITSPALLTCPGR